MLHNIVVRHNYIYMCFHPVSVTFVYVITNKHNIQILCITIFYFNYALLDTETCFTVKLQQ